MRRSTRRGCTETGNSHRTSTVSAATPGRCDRRRPRAVSSSGGGRGRNRRRNRRVCVCGYRFQRRREVIGERLVNLRLLNGVESSERRKSPPMRRISQVGGRRMKCWTEMITM